MQDLGTLGGPEATSMPSMIQGRSRDSHTRRNGHIQHAFVWMNDGTPMKDLGTLGGTNSEAQ